MTTLLGNRPQRNRENSVFRRLSVAPAQLGSMLSSTTATLRKKSVAIFTKKTDTDLDDLDLNVVRYKPATIGTLTRKTNFTRKELQIMYRGFKQECPTGIVNVDTFKEIYAQFFPRGDASLYAHHVFNTFDHDKSGTLTFEQFIQGLSVLARGSHHEKLNWIFQLYDTNNDGIISKSELHEIIHAIYELMGRHTVPQAIEMTPQEHADQILQKMDYNQDGVISIDEFMESCKNDDRIFKELSFFNTQMI